MNKHFCSLPWIHLRLDAGAGQAGVSPCCWYDMSYLYEVDPDHPSHSYVQKHGLEKAMNSKVFKDLRKNMLEGKPDTGCTRCYEEEKMHGESMRTFANSQFSIDSKTLNENFLHTKYIEVSLDNTCNLECKMCSSVHSTKLRKRDELLGNYVHPNTVYNPDMLNGLDLNQVERIKFLGGEPLISKHHLPFLKKFTDYSKMTLMYNTNATMIPNQETIDIMKQAKSLDFIISIDGIYKYNDYQRWGSNFEKIIENALVLKNTFDNIGWFTFLNTFSALNLNSYTETKAWFEKNDYPCLSNWVDGGATSACHAPDWYEEWILKNNNHPEVQTYLKKRKFNSKKWQEFIKMIEITDKLYGTKLEDYNPDLAYQLKIHNDN